MYRVEEQVIENVNNSIKLLDKWLQDEDSSQSDKENYIVEKDRLEKMKQEIIWYIKEW